MDVVMRTSYGEAEISLRSASAESTLADVVTHVTGQTSPPIVFVDGRALPATTRLDASGMLRGSTISTSEDEDDAAEGAVELVQIAGQGAGASVGLTTGRFVVGTGQRASARELDLARVERPSFELIIEDDGTVNVRARGNRVRIDGTDIAAGDKSRWSTGTLDSGDRVFQLNRRPAHRARSGSRLRADAGNDSIAFNRPHRRAPAPHAEPISTTATETIVGHHKAERDRRRSAQPHVADLLRLTHDIDPMLWERRPGDAEVFQIGIGLADLPWSPSVNSKEEDTAKIAGIVKGCGPLPMVPIDVDLSRERGVAVVGRPGFTADLARALILGAAVTHGPADLDIAILTSPDRLPDWEWAKWLPHTRSHTGTGDSPRVLFTESAVRDWADSIRVAGGDELDEGAIPDHLTVVIVDNEALWRERDAPLRPLFADTESSLRPIVLVDTAADAPAVCSAILTGYPDLSLSADFLDDRRQVHGICPFRVSVDVALSAALALAPLDDPDLPRRAEPDISRSRSFLDVLDLGHVDAEVIQNRWSNSDAHPRTTIGVTGRGSVEVDLVDHGPHGVIAGVGAGDLLQSLITGLVVNQPPSKLNFALFEFTGGGALDGCSELPHTLLIESDLDDMRATRVLRCLRAEVNRRETARDDDKQTAARLVLVVNGAESAGEKAPEFLEELAQVAQAGRDMGIHLIVATANSEYSIDSATNAEFGFRVALGPEERHTFDLVGTADDPIPFHNAQRRGTKRSAAGSGLDIRPFVIGRELSPMEHRLARTSESKPGASAQADSVVQQGLTEIFSAISTAAAATGATRRRTLCPGPLPDDLPMQPFFDAHPGDGVPFALVDLPDEQRQEPSWWRPGPDGDLLLIGDDHAGKTSLLLSLAVGLGERFSADDVHLYCIDGGTGRFGSLAHLPHIGAHVDDSGGIARLVQTLMGEVERRTNLANGIGAHRVAATEPTIVVMVDDIRGVRERLESTVGAADVWPAFEKMVSDGRPLGLCTIVTATTAGDVFAPFGLGSNPLILRLDPSNCLGRAHRERDDAEMQLVAPPSDVAATIAQLDVESPTQRPPLKGAH